LMLRNADAAMYDAKAKSRNTFRFFKKELNDQVKERLNIEAYLRHALEHHEVQVYYQPILDIHGSLVAAEALARWNNHDLGTIMPDRFIPIAEETGLIVPIGAWILKKACHDAKTWRDQTGQDIRLAVNISSRQFRGTDLIQTLYESVKESNLPPRLLDLEITENLLLDEAPMTNSILKEIYRMGIGLSIDDFGIGYSALSYLKKFTFTTLKIDRSFIRNLTVDPQDAALVTTIIGMAHNMGIRVVGEGVEREDQLEFLRFKSCDWVQGYLFSQPLPFQDFLAFARKHFNKA
jgi:EAL domain-containing protein (putative c-di-GMP-specific phosphodiesterase class I)